MSPARRMAIGLAAIFVLGCVAGVVLDDSTGGENNPDVTVEYGQLDREIIKSDGVVCYTYSSQVGSGLDCMPLNQTAVNSEVGGQ